MQDVSMPGVKERIESTQNMWASYPTLMSLFFCAIFVFFFVSEIRNKDGSFFKLVIYFFLSIGLFWNAVIDV